MTDYVVILSVGPVQSMIAAARKSRDLWSGSGLLSELAKACALSLQQQKAELIFPAITDITVLERNSDFSVGNKIQVLIQDTDQTKIRKIIDNAKKATHQRFIDEANEVKQALENKNLWSDIRQKIWLEQINDYIEIQAAWAKVGESQTYSQAVALASKVLAARKATRDFSQVNTDPYTKHLMIPKSSLDGARETVVHEDKERKIKNLTRLKLGLSQSEQLDCLGVVKRLGLKTQAEQFTAFSRIAAHAWIEKVVADVEYSEQFEEVKEAYERLVKNNLATRTTGNQGIYKDFPYDAQFLFRSRLEAELRYEQEDDAAKDSLIGLMNTLKPIWKKYGEPCPYGVLLLADGDRMGELLDKAQNKDAHKQVTTALSSFAGNVAGIMRQYDGHCIYAGGDDVLSFVPLHQAYDCAKALSCSFSDALVEVSNQLKAEKAPTLSVGLAIAHHMTPLGIIREFAQKAEKYAKGDHIKNHDDRRNALGICLDVRSGNTTMLRLKWDDVNAHQAFKDWINLYINKNIPSRIAYDTRAIDLRTKNITDNTEIQKGIQTAEFKRMLKKARVINGGTVATDHQDKLTERANQIGLQVLSDELIVSRWFAAKTQQDLGKDGS